MKPMKSLAALAATLLSWFFLSAPARAQAPEVKQVFAKPEEVKGSLWKASASAGFSISTGNASVITLSGGAFASRMDGKNRLTLELKGIYGLTDLPIVSDQNGNQVVDNENELSNLRKTTAAFLMGTIRYDRFFTTNNSGYISLNAGLDVPASKRFTGGGQIGYARQLVNKRMHLLSAELGYDLNYTNYIPPENPNPAFAEEVVLHSGRLYLGYVLAVADHTKVEANIEALINFNVAHIGDRDVGIGEASRINAQLAFTTKVWKALSLRAASSLRYNNAPGLTTQFPFAPDFPGRYNQKLDTLTELQLVITFI